MISTLEKLHNLEQSSKEEIWYVVKQELEFYKVCYAVSILEEFKNKKNCCNENLEHFFKRRSNEIAEIKNFKSFIKTHRMLLNGYIYGLIRKNGRNYNEAQITEIYKKIKLLCNGEFEKIDTYYELIEQQIEKVYFSSILDEKYNNIRKKYRLYPLFLLYKVLLEIGDKTGRYEIKKDEFLVFICTTEKYEDYKKTVNYILTTRRQNEINDNVKKLTQKFRLDIRYNRILNNLKSICETEEGFKINNSYIEIVRQKVKNFERNINNNNIASYIEFLCSDESLSK